MVNRFKVTSIHLTDKTITVGVNEVKEIGKCRFEGFDGFEVRHSNGLIQLYNDRYIIACEDSSNVEEVN